MDESERNSLLHFAPQSAVPQHRRQYSSFDNHGLWLEDERSNDIRKSLATDVKEDDEDEIHVNESAAVDTENFRDKLSGPEIIFRLKFAHIYGSLDWPNHFRRLDTETREEVHRNVLDTLREQPIDIKQKINLSNYLRESLDGTTVSESSRNPNRTKKKKHGFHIPVRDGLWNEQITKISAYFGSHVASYFVFLRHLVYMDFFLLVIVLAFVTLPQILSGEDAAPRRLEGDFGALSTSVMFYGAYSNTEWSGYDRPLAYFITWLVINAVCFLALVGSMYIRYTRSKQAETSRDEFPYCWRVLSSWDYTLTKPDGTSLHTTAIVTDTKEMIRDDHFKQRGYFRQALRMAVVRVLVNILVLVLLAVSGYLIYVVAASPDPDLYLPDTINKILATYKLPLLVSVLKLLVPLLLEQVVRLEKWHPRTEVKLNLARTALFYLASLVIFLLSVYDVSTDCIRNNNSSSSCEFCCWENDVGEDVLMVVFIDLGLILLAGLLVDVTRAIAVTCGFFTWLGYREFTVSSEVLDLIYAQSLVWLGLFFSPLLAGVGFLKLIIIFYFRYITARLCNVPPKQMFRASRSGNFFMFILLINFFVCLFVMAYAIIELPPSERCGPFMGQNQVYTVVTSRVGDMPTWLRDAVLYVSTPAIVVPVILLLLLGVLYFKAKSSSYRRVIRNLRDQLKFERRVEKRQLFARAKLQEKPGVKRKVVANDKLTPNPTAMPSTLLVASGAAITDSDVVTSGDTDWKFSSPHGKAPLERRSSLC